MRKIQLLFIIAAMTVSTGCAKIIDAGHRGIKKVWGEVEDKALMEGFYFYNPISTNILEISVRERKWIGKTEAYTNDAQNVEIQFALNWSPVPADITQLYKEKGEDYSNVLIPQVVEAELKEVTGQFKAVDLISERGRATTEMKAKITQNLAAKSIIAIDFALTNMQFNKEFEKAVEAKVVAQESAKEEQNRTVQVQEKATQQLIAAKAEAESIRIRANALSRNPVLVDFEAVQKWDGKLPVTMLGGNATPFINLPGVAGKK